MRFGLRQNLYLKLFSILLAIVCWFVVSGEEVSLKDFAVPLEYANLPRSLDLSGRVTDTVAVRLRAPEPILRAVFERAWRWGFQPVPPAALDYLKYPVTVAGERFVEATNFRCLFELGEIFQSVAR